MNKYAGMWARSRACHNWQSTCYQDYQHLTCTKRWLLTERSRAVPCLYQWLDFCAATFHTCRWHKNCHWNGTKPLTRSESADHNTQTRGKIISHHFCRRKRVKVSNISKKQFCSSFHRWWIREASYCAVWSEVWSWATGALPGRHSTIESNWKQLQVGHTVPAACEQQLRLVSISFHSKLWLWIWGMPHMSATFQFLQKGSELLQFRLCSILTFHLIPGMSEYDSLLLNAANCSSTGGDAVGPSA